MYSELVNELRHYFDDVPLVIQAADAIEELMRKNEQYRQEQLGLPSALPTPQWMSYPANEPKKGRYFVTVRYNGNLIVDIDDYFAYGWDDWHDAVVAWAELPNPYKGGWYEPVN